MVCAGDERVGRSSSRVEEDKVMMMIFMYKMIQLTFNEND